jgi:D-alanyl-D-alanine carboxypeptidase (penicillin-binding protein 5/6)
MIETKIAFLKIKIQQNLHILDIVWKKTKAILPIWGIGMGLVIAIIMAGSIWSTSQAVPLTLASANQQAEPQVLGDSIDLRGRPVTDPVTPKLSGPLDSKTVSAQSYLIADIASKGIIAEKNSDNKAYVASLTKLLTALVTYDQINISTSVPITANDVFSVSPVLGIRRGDTVKVLDLFNAMLVGSTNDAALTLANHVQDATGQNFIELMNTKAQSLGMEHSHFSNPLGFDSPGNYSTAQDLLKLVFESQKFSVFTQLGKKTSYAFSGTNGFLYKAVATDKLIGKHDEIEAIKTGYTEGAGQAMITKITKNNHSIIIIVLNSQDREGDTLNLEHQIFEKAVWK